MPDIFMGEPVEVPAGTLKTPNYAVEVRAVESRAPKLGTAKEVANRTGANKLTYHGMLSALPEERHRALCAQLAAEQILADADGGKKEDRLG